MTIQCVNKVNNIAYNKPSHSCHPEERRISKRTIVWDPSQAQDDSAQNDIALLKKYLYNKPSNSCHPEERRISQIVLTNLNLADLKIERLDL